MSKASLMLADSEPRFASHLYSRFFLKRIVRAALCWYRSWREGLSRPEECLARRPKCSKQQINQRLLTRSESAISRKSTHERLAYVVDPYL